MTETPPPPPSDETPDELDDELSGRVRSALLAVEPVDDAVRSRHLAAAMAAFDEQSAEPAVIDLDSRRTARADRTSSAGATRAWSRISVAAAALVLLVGGSVLAISANSGDDNETFAADSASDAASMAESSAESSTASGGSADGSDNTRHDGFADDQTTEDAGTDAGDSTARSSATESAEQAAGAAPAPMASGVGTHLGSFETTDELAAAVRAVGNAVSDERTTGGGSPNGEGDSVELDTAAATTVSPDAAWSQSTGCSFTAPVPTVVRTAMVGGSLRLVGFDVPIGDIRILDPVTCDESTL